MKLDLLNQFLECPEYKASKEIIEKEYFKVLGDYQYLTGSSTLTTLCANKVKEQFKNKTFSITSNPKPVTWGQKQITYEPKLVTKSFYEIWSEDPKMREYTGITFDCDVDRVPKHIYNMFQGFNKFEDVNSADVDLSDILDHYMSLTGYNEDQYTYLMNWLAHAMQKPYELPHTCMVIISEEGVGKDMAFQHCSNTFGKQYCLGTDKLEQVCGKFNSLLGGKIFVMINEVNPVESRERQENIKFLVTAETVTIEEKYKNPIITKMFARFLFFSNRLTAFPVQKTSRRPVIVQASNKYLPVSIGAEESYKHFEKLRIQMNDKRYMKAFAQHLQSIDISNWNPREIPKSSLRKDLEEGSQSPIVEYVAHIAKTMDNTTLKMNVTECYNKFTEKSKLQYQYSQAKFNVELCQLFGIEKTKSSSMFYVFCKEKLIQVLESKYGYNFEAHYKITDDHPNVENDTKVENDNQEATIKQLQEQVKQLQEQLQQKDKRIQTLIDKNIVENIEWMSLMGKALSQKTLRPMQALIEETPQVQKSNGIKEFQALIKESNDKLTIISEKTGIAYIGRDDTDDEDLYISSDNDETDQIPNTDYMNTFSAFYN